MCFFALCHACSVDKVFDYQEHFSFVAFLTYNIFCFVHLKQESSICVALHRLQTVLSKINNNMISLLLSDHSSFVALLVCIVAEKTALLIIMRVHLEQICLCSYSHW